MYTKEQQRANRQKWVQALRSGKYKQTVGTLKDNKGFCCFGVACDISDLGEWDSNNNYISNGEMNTGILPDSVKEWLGLCTAHGGYEKTTLTLNNDIEKSFEDIADIIENEPKGLVVK